MGYEDKTGLNVSNYYGARTTGGSEGQLPTAGATREVTIDWADATPLHDELWIPEGALFVSYTAFGTTGAVKTVDAAGADVIADVTALTAGDAINGKLTWAVEAGKDGKAVLKYDFVTK